MTPPERLRAAAVKARETHPDSPRRALAVALADLLDDQAGVFETFYAEHGFDVAERIVWRALAVADAVLAFGSEDGEPR